MKDVFRKHWTLLFSLGTALITAWVLVLPGYFSHHDDLQTLRVFEMRRCFSDGQIPCRWTPDMGYGFGYPLFNYYNPGIYYIAALFSYFVGYLLSVKLIFAISLIAGPLGVYFFAKKYWGDLSALTASIVFSLAPYRAVDAYVRGALSELFALSLVPFIFLFMANLVEKKTKQHSLIFIILMVLFLITHNVSTVMWFPFFGLWGIYLTFRDKSAPKYLIPTLLLGVGLSAFFTVPAYFEKNLVSTETLVQGDLDYRLHFASYGQLFFDKSWGYGASKPGPDDGLSLQIGWPHWWIVAFVVLALFYISYKKRKLDKKLLLSLIFIFGFGFSIFMTHNKSTFIWESFNILHFIQFPWRYLGLAVFFASILGGYLIYLAQTYFFAKSSQNKTYLLAFTLIALAIGFNIFYFRPEKFYLNATDTTKLTGRELEGQQKGAIYDYLPKTAVVPESISDGKPKVLNGDVEITNFHSNSNSWSFDVSDAGKGFEIEVPVFYFPGWKSNYNIFTAGNGRMVVTGNASGKVQGEFDNTPVRKIANLISLFSIILTFIYLSYGKIEKHIN